MNRSVRSSPTRLAVEVGAAERLPLNFALLPRDR
jgi:hypothetical protein